MELKKSTLQGLTAAGLACQVGAALPRLACELRPDVLAALVRAQQSEPSERGRRVLAQLVENAALAARDKVPLCQDTGTVWVWLEAGADYLIPSDIFTQVDDAVAAAYRSSGLRMSLVADALCDRVNTGDNTPAFCELTLNPRLRGARLHLMLKGGGSDNASRLAMLPPGSGWEGVRDFVLGAVGEKGANACPPLVIGVGVGATFDKVAGLSKRALLREVGSVHENPELAELEASLLASVNASNIGPGGLGGQTTALAVHIQTAPCHIAALPVAVNIGCSALRSVSIEL